LQEGEGFYGWKGSENSGKGKKVSEQNALDERTALFLHETEPPMELEIELDEIPFEPDISDR
jgi:hypothetical protein